MSLGRLDPASPYRLMMEDYERGMIQRALEGADGNVTLTAQRLGVTRKFLHSRIRKLKVERPGKGANGAAHEAT